MVQLPAENSILAAAVRRAADEHRLSHAVILTGRGDLTAAANDQRPDGFLSTPSARRATAVPA